jgi:phosphoglucosamine mutase
MPLPPVPQLLQSVRLNDGAAPLQSLTVQAKIKAAQDSLGNRGRVLVRASGTEPVIRVMVEGDDAAMVQGVVNDLCETIRAA